MPSATFNHLALEKRTRIRKALLKEFSNYSLEQAQVARIVKNAGIARGAFYKYFDSLTAAYVWLLNDVMDQLNIHYYSIEQHKADEFVMWVNELNQEVQESAYRDLLIHHYQTNAGVLRESFMANHRCNNLDHLTSREWAVMVLCHEAFRELLLKEAADDDITQRLRQSLFAVLGR